LSGFVVLFKSSKKLAAFDELVTRRLLSVALTRWLYTERLVEVVSELKIELNQFLKSAMNDKKKSWTAKRIFLLDDIMIFFKMLTSISI
jgi:hypothetical protein